MAGFFLDMSECLDIGDRCSISGKNSEELSFICP